MPVHDKAERILLDQNIPQAISNWLKKELTDWDVHHVNELGFQGKQDDFLYLWALENKAIIVTYDEDFADSRFYQLGEHYGVIRLRVWPTTIEQTQNAIERLIKDLPPTRWHGCLIIVDSQKIRVRKVR